ncbi:MAG: radical SAM protein [Gammaproteobacteria bacterium]|nr:radical SAM protein [Gammaproteobacteria bacterium]NIR98392.1 radical SAM protein [Gammaproteobacteria bacterium]NIT64146.1 radical SAM protein [Gammaproteobacteria bacterium]NIV21083.1 radical SAM protein [Gammaproteobacteria bacterium]NIY32726.1 radical SAM protein [Gammaproteobacteria bacterium]
MTTSPQAAQAPSAPAATIAYERYGNCYLNITNRCTLRCAFCPKFNKVWNVRGYGLRLREEPTVNELVVAAGDPARYCEVVFCGLGEPLLALDVVLEAAGRLKARGARIRVNTDGLANLAHGRDVTQELAGRVDALSVSLNAQNDALYDRHCRPALPGAFGAVLDFLRCARAHVPEVTATAIDGLPGVDIEECRRIAAGLGVGFRRRVLDRVG